MKKYLLIIFLLLGLNNSLVLAKESTKKGETMGISLNPIRLFALGSTQTLSLTGTFSYFDNDNSVEYAIPFFYQQEFLNDSANLDNGLEYQSINEKLATLDFQYRKYFRKSSTEGLYYGGLLRYTYLEGDAKYRSGVTATQHKFGVGILTGFQLKGKIEDMDFYWGANISFGGYLNKEVDVMSSDFSVIFGEDGRLFIDIELLKFGIEF